MTALAPRLCYITDRQALEPVPLLPIILETIQAGIDLIQIREKDLATPELFRLVQAGAGAARGSSTRVVVNDRLDIALAAGAHGVHLGGQSMPAGAVRAVVPEGFWVGVSCHSPAEALAAEAAGADYILLGPIFETKSKLRYGPPLGLAALEQAARSARIPVLALGGITLERVRRCLEAGATGVAGISIFQESGSPRARVRELRQEIGLN
jgi:thiamine-phosphate pyrophosphorylase